MKKILDCYESDNPSTKKNLSNILMAGKLGGTGKMIILPVDQGFEHVVNHKSHHGLHHKSHHGSDHRLQKSQIVF